LYPFNKMAKAKDAKKPGPARRVVPPPKPVDRVAAKKQAMEKKFPVKNGDKETLPMPADTEPESKQPGIAETMAKKQREISVSEFFLKNRHLLGFDNPRKALLTTVKEAVDNSLDAAEEADILPEVSVEMIQISENRFRVIVTDNGPGIVRAQIPKIFAKLLYGSKFHRLRMSRGQQGIGISAAGMYGQLTTGCSTRITSKIRPKKKGHYFELQIDTRKNEPQILKDEEINWQPEFFGPPREEKPEIRNPKSETKKTKKAKEEKSEVPKVRPASTSPHGTRVEIELEAKYQTGKQSVDEFLQQCAIANPHVTFRYRVQLLPKAAVAQASLPVVEKKSREESQAGTPVLSEQKEAPWQVFERGAKQLPTQPNEIKPHPHGIELGMLMQMLKDTPARRLKAFLHQDFSRVSDRVALEICSKAGLDPKSRPSRVAFQESENLFKSINDTKLMNPPTDCISPIGEEQILAGLKKEIQADFYEAVTRPPAVYRGNPFQIELGAAYQNLGKMAGSDSEKKNGETADIAKQEGVSLEEPIRLLRFANRVPLLYQQGACAVTKSVTSMDWKNYGLSQPKGSLPLGPIVLFVHMASVWVPFTSESKEAIASYDEILREITLGLQELGRRLSVYLSRRRRQLEAERKRNYMELYIPHLALGLKQILKLKDKEEGKIVTKLKKMLERTHLAA
jgi:DNA topoisomerase-6 subunit B